MSKLQILPLAAMAATVIAVGCSKTPDSVISPERMAPLLADLYVGEAVIDASPGNYPDDSSRRALQQSIYMKHGVTAEQMDSSLSWYGRNLDQYMKVCENTEKILSERIDRTEKLAGQTAPAPTVTSLDGDSVNLWPGIAYRRLTSSQASDYTTFALFTDKNWERGDRYTLSLEPKFANRPITVALTADYNDGTSEFVTRRHTSPDEPLNIRLVLDSAKVATSVYGYILYTPMEGEDVAYLNNIRLVRTRGQNDNKKAREGQKTSRHRQ